MQHAPCKWPKTGIMVSDCGLWFVLFASRPRLDLFSSSSRCHFAVFSFGIRYVLDRVTNNERKHNERRMRDEREVNEKRTIIGWLAGEFCSQMYKTITLHAILLC